MKRITFLLLIALASCKKQTNDPAPTNARNIIVGTYTGYFLTQNNLHNGGGLGSAEDWILIKNPTTDNMINVKVADNVYPDSLNLVVSGNTFTLNQPPIVNSPLPMKFLLPDDTLAFNLT